MTEKPWFWWVMIEGELDQYRDQEIAFVFTTYKREEFPTISVFTGLKRIHHFSTKFDNEYYLELIGKSPYSGDDAFWNRNPASRVPHDNLTDEPIDGWDSAFDGKFWIKIDVWTVDIYEPAINRIKFAERLGSTYVRGKLDCIACRV
jgi:hypothetical protein